MKSGTAKTPKQNTSELLLNIRYYQNNSWQGSVQRLDTGETINFRSALELMHLIEEVAGQKAAHEEGVRRIRRWKKVEGWRKSSVRRAFPASPIPHRTP